MTSSNPPVPSTVNDQLVGILPDDVDLKFETIAATTYLIDNLGMDSVALAAGPVATEERFGAQLSEQDLSTCTTVGDLQAAIGAGVGA